MHNFISQVAAPEHPLGGMQSVLVGALSTLAALAAVALAPRLYISLSDRPYVPLHAVHPLARSRSSPASTSP